MKKIALMFPGQGKQYPGIYKDLYDRFGVVKETFEEASDALGIDVRKLCFESSLEEILKLENSQKCVMTTEIAGARLCKYLGIKPSVLIGHSFGECAAVVVADVMPFSQGLYLGEKRAEYMHSAVPAGTGGMLVIIDQSIEQIQELCSRESGRVWISNYNSPTQTVLSGELEAIERLYHVALDNEISAVQVAVDVASHCPLMKPAAEKMHDYLSKIPFLTAQISIASNCSGKFITDPLQLKTELAEQLITPVQFMQSVENAILSGVNVFIEVGPGKSLSGNVQRINKEVISMRIENIETLGEVCASLGLGTVV